MKMKIASVSGTVFYARGRKDIYLPEALTYEPPQERRSLCEVVLDVTRDSVHAQRDCFSTLSLRPHLS